MCCGFILLRMAAKPDLVRYRPSCQAKSGPVFMGCECIYAVSAVIGHNRESLRNRCIVVPMRKGSVFDAFM